MAYSDAQEEGLLDLREEREMKVHVPYPSKSPDPIGEFDP